MTTLRGIAQPFDRPLPHTLLAYWRSLLECVAKPSFQVVEAYERAAKMEERLVDVVPPLVAHRKPTVARKPRKRTLDGLLANDKFCMIRHARLSLSHSRRPNLTQRQTDVATAGSAYPPAGITRHGGDDETSVAPTSGSDGTPGCEAALGSSVPGHLAVEPRKRASSCSEGEWRGGVS